MGDPKRSRFVTDAMIEMTARLISASDERTSRLK
jgi:hypothetical protein